MLFWQAECWQASEDRWWLAALEAPEGPDCPADSRGGLDVHLKLVMVKRCLNIACAQVLCRIWCCRTHFGPNRSSRLISKETCLKCRSQGSLGWFCGGQRLSRISRARLRDQGACVETVAISAFLQLDEGGDGTDRVCLCLRWFLCGKGRVCQLREK